MESILSEIQKDKVISLNLNQGRRSRKKRSDQKDGEVEDKKEIETRCRRVVTLISKALVKNTSVRSVDFGHTMMNDSSAELFARVLKQKSDIREASLSNNQIQAGGCIAIAEALEFNAQLSSLNLAHNSILDEGATAIAVMLVRLSLSLFSFSLSLSLFPSLSLSLSLSLCFFLFFSFSFFLLPFVRVVFLHPLPSPPLPPQTVQEQHPLPPESLFV